MNDPKQVVKGLMKKAEKNNSITSLLEISQQIAGWLVYISELEGLAFQGYNEAVYARKNFEATYVQKSEDSVSKAKEMAIVESSELREAEAAMESEYRQWQIFRVTARDYHEALRQKISYLKSEFQNQKSIT
jgi:hypothetical protein